MRLPKLITAAILLAFGLIQFFQAGMVAGLKMANAANGIDLAIGSRLLIHVTLFVLCTIAAWALWRWSRPSQGSA